MKLEDFNMMRTKRRLVRAAFFENYHQLPFFVAIARPSLMMLKTDQLPIVSVHSGISAQHPLHRGASRDPASNFWMQIYSNACS